VGNGKMTREEYIAKYKDDAVRDMKKTGVPASITLAQALLESSDGNSPLAVEANNHFGVKCADWKGPTYIQDDDHKDECFRKYKNVLESYDDHSNFLRTRSRYAGLFENDITDYKSWARGLKKAGYATNPAYADRLIKIIEDNKLYELDRDNTYAAGEKAAAYEPTASVQAKTVKHKPSVKYTSPMPDIVNPYDTHEVFKTNDIPYVIARSNDTYRKIADEFVMGAWQVFKYNDLNRNAGIKEGQKIYLKPKKRSGLTSTYTVKSGQTLHDISQEQGVKMKLLMKWNNLGENTSVQPGQKLVLKKG
jgi:LysM repeat protein